MLSRWLFKDVIFLFLLLCWETSAGIWMVGHVQRNPMGRELSYHEVTMETPIQVTVKKRDDTVSAHIPPLIWVRIKTISSHSKQSHNHFLAPCVWPKCGEYTDLLERSQGSSALLTEHWGPWTTACWIGVAPIQGPLRVSGSKCCNSG